jgi:hypothetical protein
MNCLSLTRKRPARGKTKRADSTAITWTKKWNEKGQFPPMGESRSGLFATQEEEHNVMTGMPDAKIMVMTNRTRCFLVIFIYCGPLFNSVSRPL